MSQTNFSMENSDLDTKDDGSDVYLSLGLEVVGKAGAAGKPCVLSILSSLLERRVQKNEKLIQSKQIKSAITLFHGTRAPDLSIQQYLDRIFRYSACSPSCFVVAHVYMDRYFQRRDAHLTSLNVHRLLVTSIMVAAKFVDDAFFNNAYFARVGGISTGELNRMEMKLLFDLDFRLHVSVETFRSYCSMLEMDGAGGLPIERPIKACGITRNWSNVDETSCAPSVAVKVLTNCHAH